MGKETIFEQYVVYYAERLDFIRDLKKVGILNEETQGQAILLLLEVTKIRLQKALNNLN